MARPRRFRYTPSTTDTVSWTHRCGRRTHHVHWHAGALTLPDHAPEEWTQVLVKHSLGLPIPPCFELWVALRALQADPALRTVDATASFPHAIRQAILVARYARRHYHPPYTDDRARHTLRQACAVRFFRDLLTALTSNQLTGTVLPLWPAHASTPTVVLPYDPTQPLLTYVDRRWDLTAEALTLLTPQSRFDTKGDEIRRYLEQWATTRNRTRHG